jgi:hypothetical protein
VKIVPISRAHDNVCPYLDAALAFLFFVPERQPQLRTPFERLHTVEVDIRQAARLLHLVPELETDGVVEAEIWKLRIAPFRRFPFNAADVHGTSPIERPEQLPHTAHQN